MHIYSCALIYEVQDRCVSGRLPNLKTPIGKRLPALRNPVGEKWCVGFNNACLAVFCVLPSPSWLHCEAFYLKDSVHGLHPWHPGVQITFEVGGLFKRREVISSFSGGAYAIFSP